MRIVDELQALEQMYHNGTLTDAEFQAAKTSILARADAGTQAGSPMFASDLADIRFQNELERLDREWALERERYIMTGRYGRRYLPGRVSSIATGAIGLIFGVIWTVLASSMSAGWFPVFGVAFMIIVLISATRSFIKAEQYEQAKQVYEQRRSQLLATRPGSGFRP